MTAAPGGEGPALDLSDLGASDLGGADFWAALDRLVASATITIDRPRGSAHPRFAGAIYPLDYGCLEGTLAMDGQAVDLWRGAARTGSAPGSEPLPRLTGLICTVDLQKRDVEVKLLLDCTPAESRSALAFHNRSGQHRGWWVERPES